MNRQLFHVNQCKEFSDLIEREFNPIPEINPHFVQNMDEVGVMLARLRRMLVTIPSATKTLAGIVPQGRAIDHKHCDKTIHFYFRTPVPVRLTIEIGTGSRYGFKIWFDLSNHRYHVFDWRYSYTQSTQEVLTPNMTVTTALTDHLFFGKAVDDVAPMNTLLNELVDFLDDYCEEVILENLD